MIRLTKAAAPAVLGAKAAEWTAEYERRLAAGTVKGYRPWGHPEIKAAVIEETREKCAYCESYARHVTYGDVEHILPKSVRPELVVAWENLTFVCDVCNTNKGDYYSEDEPLLNPYSDDPPAHIMFLGDMVMHRPGSAMGERTVLRVDLDRAELRERREERLRALKRLADRWVEAREAGKIELARLLEVALRSETEGEREYAAAVRDFFRQHLGWDA